MNITRVGIFFDGNFLLHSSNYYNYIHPIHKRLSIDGLRKFALDNVIRELKIYSDFCCVSQCHYFRGRLSAVDAAARGNQLYNDRVFDDILMSEGVETHYLPLRNNCGRREESGTNVWLSLQVLELAMRNEIDIAVLVVGDTDYLPLVRKLAKLNVITVVMGWDFEYVNDEGQKISTKTSQELKNVADMTMPMCDLIENGLKDGNELVNDIFVGCIGLK